MKARRSRLIELRESLGMTQDMLAAKSNVAHRTVQRAEAGEPIATETLAQLAATLGVTQAELVERDKGLVDDEDLSMTLVLQPVRVPKEITDLFRDCEDATVDCLVDTSGKGNKSAAVIEFLDAIEGRLPTLTPEIDLSQTVGPSQSQTLKDRIALEQRLAAAMEKLKSEGLQVYGGRYIRMIVVPRYDVDEGCWFTRNGQAPSPVKTAALRISTTGKDRLVERVDVGSP